MNIMFDQLFSVVHQQLAVSLKHENVIYVFEDVDAASKIVQCRKKMAAQARQASVAPPATTEGKGDAAAESEESGNEYDKLDLSVRFFVRRAFFFSLHEDLAFCSAAVVTVVLRQA